MCSVLPFLCFILSSLIEFCYNYHIFNIIPVVQSHCVMQEKYEKAMGSLAEMEKRVVMAESMLEATLQYQTGQVKAHCSPRYMRIAFVDFFAVMLFLYLSSQNLVMFEVDIIVKASKGKSQMVV